MVKSSPNGTRDANYEAPALVTLGTLHELTLLDFCDKRLSGSDGFTFMGQPITCRNSA